MGGGGGDDAKLFVGGLSQETTKESLRSHFSIHGPLTDAVVMYDPTSGRSRGFGFVTFENSESIKSVLASPQTVDEKEVDCKRACPREIMASRQAGEHQPFKTTKIFVGGLPDLTTEEFKEYFSKYGNVVDAALMTDKNSNRPRGFGFITYESPEIVEEVCRKYHDHQIKDKWVEVKKAQSKEQLQPRSQNERGGSFGGYGGAYGQPTYGGYYEGFRGQYPSAYDHRRGYCPMPAYDPYAPHPAAAYGYSAESVRRSYAGRGGNAYRDPYMGGYAGHIGGGAGGSSYGPPGSTSTSYGGGGEGGGGGGMQQFREQHMPANTREQQVAGGRGRREYFEDLGPVQSAGYGPQRAAAAGRGGEWPYQPY
eukprot:GHVS01082541.1.p1 GENE.GHVS01082541.1~~GHVS01082541.1.p1  ORF type:complete len:396 (-),score=55.87 GHVS01082541.1:68-1165(-)